MRDMKNPLWRDTLQAWRDYIKSFTIETIDEILYSPIWYNTLINTEFNICYNDWYNKGIRTIIDLVSEEGMFYIFNELKNKYNIRGTFLDLHRLISHLPNTWEKKDPRECRGNKIN